MSENASMFADVAERLFAETCPIETVAAAEQGQFPRGLWDALEAAGVLSMLLDEADGGANAALADAGAILRSAGRHAAPGPILETLLARRLAADTGLAVPAGPLALAFADGPRRVRARWARAAEAALIIARGPDATVLHLAAPTGLSEGSDASFEPLDSLDLPGGAPVAVAAAVFDQALAAAALLRAGQMLGALDWCVERALAFAGEREQFGKAIGGFQVIQHHLVALAEEVVAAAAIVGAAEAAGPGEQAMLTAAARSRLGDAVDAARWLAHQVHGAIGFTREYPLNFRTRRLIAWRDDFGSTVYWRERLAERLIGGPAESLWSRVIQA